MRGHFLSRALIAAAGLMLGGGALAVAQPTQPKGPKRPQVEQTPFNYELVNGQRIAKGNRVSNPDGSWREMVRQGNCTTVKEKSAAGVYKETRSCG